MSIHLPYGLYSGGKTSYMSNKYNEASEKKQAQAVNNGATAESTHAVMPPSFGQPIQAKPEEDHDHHNENEHDHENEHEHDHDIQGAPTADGENGRNGIYDPGEKDDKFDKEITDTDPDFAQVLQKMIFKSQNYGPIDMTSATTTGGFRASYNPNTQQLNIGAICQAGFINGLQLDPATGFLLVNPTGYASKDAILQQQANFANRNLNLADRAAFLADYTWTPQEITDGMVDLQTQLRVAEDVWSGNHSFFVDKEGWRDIRAKVNVNITATQGTAVDGTDHLQINTIKSPANGPDMGALVGSYGDVTQNANEMFIDDDNLSGVNDNNFLHQIVDFPGGGSTLTAQHKALLDMMIIRHRDDNTRLKANANPADDAISNGVENKFRLVGHCSSDGSASANQKVAADRIKAVQDYLVAGGLDLASSRIETENKGEEGATEDPEWRRVDIYVGSGEAQHTISHEFGHVFGLKDEYALDAGGGLGGTGRTSGTVVGHDGLSTGIGAANATSENNDGIMSMGNEVRGQHYSTFGEALKRLTNLPEWRLIT